jgi:acyl-CoA dehydrogenase
VPRSFFRKLGEIGVMGMAIPEKYGGSGEPDYRYHVILQEEASRALVTMGTVRTQLDVILPYFLMSLREPAVWQTPGVVAAGR